MYIFLFNKMDIQLYMYIYILFDNVIFKKFWWLEIYFLISIQKKYSQQKKEKKNYFDIL